ncbi:MAG TPA: hypothetical protein VFF06_26475 [Polyangia bacterium]|nr:hypothetical protein [Polyangia bacterium]
MKRAALIALVVIAGTLAWRAGRRGAPDAKLLFDRFWIDHAARDGREEFQALFVDGEHPFGNFATRTWWTGKWELFHYHLSAREDGTLDIIFPRTNERERVRYRARTCDEQGFDFCLEIEGASRGVRRYFSKKGWEVKNADLDAVADRLFGSAVQ